MKKKLIGILLVVALFFTMSPLSVFATDSIELMANNSLQAEENTYVENIQFKIKPSSNSLGQDLALSSDFNSQNKNYTIQITDALRNQIITYNGSVEIAVTLQESAKQNCSAYCIYQDAKNNKEVKMPLESGFNELKDAFYSQGQLESVKVQIVQNTINAENGETGTVLDEYTIKVNYQATLKSITVKTNGIERPLNETIGEENYSYSVDIPKAFEKVNINTLANLTGASISINNQTMPTTDVTIAWDEAGKMEIPIQVSKDGYQTGSYTLTLVRSETDYMPIITSNLSKKKQVYTQGDTIKPLSIVVKTEGDGTIAYQWYKGMSKTAQNQKINGAAESSYTPPSNSTTSPMGEFYRCKIMYTVQGKTYTIYSDVANIQIKALVAATPTFVSDLQDEVNVMQGKDITLKVVATRTGSGVLSYQWYHKTGVGTQGEKIEGATEPEYQVDTSLAGEDYYYCVVTNTIQEKTASATSKTVKVVVNSLQSAFSKGGKGTEENPFIIEEQADIKKLQELVNQGNSLNGIYFELKNDISLPADWVPIGCTKDGTRDIKKGDNLYAFSGHLNGGGNILTVPKGGKPLLGYVKGATVKNLVIYGEEIDGYGLVNNFEGVGLKGNAILIDNVTIKSGSKIKKAGLLGAEITTNGFAGVSAAFTAMIRNCTIQKGVVIGYDGKQSQIGSFAGRMQGTIENCVSEAEVKGISYVGGIIGTRDNAMGECSIKNCKFNGKIDASGDNVGGIAGGGYSNDSAPNGVKITILACRASGKVSGKKNVGGILGADVYVAQAWDSYSFAGNVFDGKIKGEENVGGIIGFYDSLNKFDNIRGNLYVKNCGVTKGIGSVKYVDTNMKNVKKEEGVLYINTEKGTSDCPKVEWCDWKSAHNRTDDPLGKDMENLAKMLDSLPNEAICYELVLKEGNVKTDYYLGEDFSFGNAKFTAKWTDGTEKEVAAKDITVSGYNKNSHSIQNVTLTCGYGQMSVQVAVKQKESGDVKKDTLTVSFTLLGDSVHDEADQKGGPHGLAMGGLSTWMSGSYEVKINSTVWDLMQQIQRDNSKVKFLARGSQYGTYVYGVTYDGITLSEFDNGNLSGWMYTLNGKHPEVGVAAQFLSDRDAVVFHYTDDYTKEEGSEKWNTPGADEVKNVTTSGAAGSATTTAPTEVKVNGSTATATIKAENQSEILKQAVDKKSAEIILEVSKADSKGADSVQLSLDVTFVKNVADKTDADLTVNTENGKVTLDQETLKTIIGEAKGNTVIIEITKVTKPTEAQKKAAGANGHLLKLTIKSGDKVISDFNKGKVKVVAEIVSKLLDKKVAAIHIADDGKIEQLAGKVLTIGGKKYYEFTTPHFSTFALVDADELGLEVAEEPTVDAKALTAKLTPVARSAKTAKKNVKVTVSLDKQDKAIIKELKDAGYTVKYRFYRSTKKAAGYKAAVTKKTSTYTNTGGKKGTKYYYKVQVRVYDADGKLAAKTALKQCKYASRTWTKGK